jgi:hypothetical protein
MALLRMRDATFARADVTAGPVTLDLDRDQRVALHCQSAKEASILALLATGIVKATAGCVLINDFDPRVQSVHCKRAAALVSHEPLTLEESEFARYIAYRAALWNIDPNRARTHASLLRKRLAGMHEALAYPLIGALIGMPRLVVLDRPEPVYARLILDAVDGRALLSTHADAAAARAFAPGGLARLRAAGA